LNTHLELRVFEEIYFVKRIITVGGSAGGIKALCSLLKGIPQSFPAPILQRCTVLNASGAAHDIEMLEEVLVRL